MRDGSYWGCAARGIPPIAAPRAWANIASRSSTIGRQLASAGAVARTSAFALNNATLPFVLKLAGQGAEAAMKADPHLANGLNVSGGKIRHQAVAEALDLPFEAAA